MSRMKARKTIALHQVSRLDLSFGDTVADGFTRPNGFDPCSVPWAIPSNSVEEAYSAYMLNRIPGEQRMAWMRELWRVLVPEGKCTIIVPYWASPRSIQDPESAWPPLSEQSFLYFNKQFRENNRLPSVDGCNFDFCVSPDTQILTDDLRWVDAKYIQEGDTLFGVDEFTASKGLHRRVQKAVVEHVERFEWDRVIVHSDRGHLVCTPEHPFLARSKGRPYSWFRADKLQAGWMSKFICEPWDEDLSNTWFSGMLDGEGSVCLPKRNGRFSGMNLTISQRPGAVLDRVSKIASSEGKCAVYSKNDRTSDCMWACVSGISNVIKLVGKYRPLRMIPKMREIIASGRLGLPGTRAMIIAVNPYHRGEVVAIRTSTRTLITNGFVTHNTYGYTLDPETLGKSDDVRPFWIKHYVNAVADLQMVLTKKPK